MFTLCASESPDYYALWTVVRAHGIISGMIDPTEQRWMRVEEAAVYARVGVTYIRKLIRTRRLPAINTGRYYVIDRFKLDACLVSLEGPKRK